jgi:predicted TIM-barrel fold metal-dependent hydrolase
VSDVALIERAEELLAGQGEQIKALLPEGCEPFDAHTHLGLDIDGHTLSVEQHLALMDGAGVCGANVFALNEPDREPAYRAPNDRVLRWAAEAPDRLFPFVRLSLDEDPVGEAVRCLDLGARGIKLHPRAQAFTVDDPRLDGVFALAHERKVPVLIHAGRGLPPGMPLQLGHVAERYPDASLILAHAAIVAQAGVGKLARSVENIFFDSSTWTPLDQLNLMSLVPPEQILWASDIPYGEPLAALNVFVRSARVSGASDELLRGMLRDNAMALLEGRRPATRSAPLAKPEFSTSYARIRATMYMAGATSLLWLNQAEIVGYLGMAEAALAEEGLDRQAELVRCARAVWDRWAETIVPGAPPDAAGRGRVWRLLNQAQADTLLA